MSNIFRKGQSYSLADAKVDTLNNNDVVGVFRRNESVAIRGKLSRAGGVQKLLEDLSDKTGDDETGEKRRGSEGVNSLDVSQYLETRRNSSPAINTDTVLPRMRRKKSSESSLDKHERQKKRHSSYIELLEEVTNELNLEAVKVETGSNHTESEAIQNAFHFLDDEIEVFIMQPQIYIVLSYVSCRSPWTREL